MNADGVMSDLDRASAALARLRSRGIRISIDHFGAAHTSLAQVQNLPIDELKLDLSLAIPMGDDPRAAATVASTVALARSLAVPVVAAGVENFRTFAGLARYGCDQAQGFYVSGPVPAAQLEDLLTPAGSVASRAEAQTALVD